MPGVGASEARHALQRPVTISDVAAAAGVSRMTVSNVLSGDVARRRHASQKTRERVLEVACQMRYRPNTHAIALKKKLANIFGFYSGYGYLNPENAFVAAILGGLQEGCDTCRKDLLVHGTFRGISVADIYAEMVDGRTDGLVLYGPIGDPLVEMLADSHLPVVAVVDRLPAFPSVVADDITGALMQANHLAARGYDTVIYHIPRQSVESAEHRYRAFRTAAANFGMEVQTITVSGEAPGKDSQECDFGWITKRDRSRKTAAVCWNDPVAYDMLAYCYRVGVSIPCDLGIIGFDGVISPRITGRQVTTVRANWAKVGIHAVSVLDSMLAGEQPPAQTVVPVELVPGDTV